MQASDKQGAPAPREDAIPRDQQTIYCPRHGRHVAVTFETSRGLFPMRTDVAHCPLRSEGRCDLVCLSPVGGTVFS